MTPADETLMLLRQLPDTGELVFKRRVPSSDSSYDGHWYAWDEAHEEAELAYEVWRETPGAESYAVYRAAQDRADAAQDALGTQSAGPR